MLSIRTERWLTYTSALGSLFSDGNAFVHSASTSSFTAWTPSLKIPVPFCTFCEKLGSGWIDRTLDLSFTFLFVVKLAMWIVVIFECFDKAHMRFDYQTHNALRASQIRGIVNWFQFYSVASSLLYQPALRMRISVKKCALLLSVQPCILCISKRTWGYLSHTQYSFSFPVYSYEKSQNRYWPKVRVFLRKIQNSAHF